MSPFLYGEPNYKAFNNAARDVVEKDAYLKAKKLGIPCVGICRGAQFLTVMNGGKLYQHVDNHTRYHELVVNKTGEKFQVSSTHHQMMRPEGTNHVVVASANESTYKFDGYGKDVFDATDYEVVYYPDTRDLAVQYHPEIMNADSRGFQFFLELLETYYGK